MTSFLRHIQNVGLMCTIDLFPAPDSSYQPDSPLSLPESSGGKYHGSRDSQAYPYTYFPLHPYTSANGGGPRALQLPFQLPRRQLMLGHLRESEIPPDVTYRVGNHLVTESSKMTPAVVGEKVVEPALVDYNGRKALVFVFGVSIMSTCDCVMCGKGCGRV